MKLNTLQDLMIDQLNDLWSAEQLVTEALPKMALASSSPDLRQAFEQHIKTTKGQIIRLDEVFNKLGINHDGKKCEGMEGLLREGDHYIKSDADPSVRDAALIAAAQRVEHYEMAGYSSVKTYARELGYNDIADLLQENIDEEGETDKQFSSLAKGGFFSTGINEEAPR